MDRETPGNQPETPPRPRELHVIARDPQEEADHEHQAKGKDALPLDDADDVGDEEDPILSAPEHDPREAFKIGAQRRRGATERRDLKAGDRYQVRAGAISGTIRVVDGEDEGPLLH